MIDHIASDSVEVGQVRELARTLVLERSDESRVQSMDEQEQFDLEFYNEVAAAGLVALDAEPGERRAADPWFQVAVLEELAAGPTSMAVCMVVQYMAAGLLVEYGTPDQQASVLSPLLAGGSRLAFALTEPDGGTDIARAMRVKASRVAEGWRLQGTKTWISGADTSQHAIVLARTRPVDGSPIRGITMFLVPLDAPGVTVRALPTVAIHSLGTCEVHFSDVVVRDEDILGEEGRGFRQVLGTLNRERLNAAAVALGISRAALAGAIRYAKERRAFGRTVGGFQVLQHRLVDDLMAIEGARGLLVQAVQAYRDGSREADALAAMAKIATAEAAVAATDNGMRLLGGAGFSREFAMQRLWRDARLYTFAPLSNEMSRNFIGEHALGLERSF